MFKKECSSEGTSKQADTLTTKPISCAQHNTTVKLREKQILAHTHSRSLYEYRTDKREISIKNRQ